MHALYLVEDILFQTQIFIENIILPPQNLSLVLIGL